MDKDILIQYSEMKEEIKDLRRRIQKISDDIDKLGVVSDSVTCGKRGKKPLGTKIVRGYPYPRYQRMKAIQEIRQKRLKLKEEELLELTNKAEEYIDSIESSELRIMFRLYYIDNLIWDMVAMKMNYMFPKRRIAYTGDNCRIRHDRYLEKTEKS